MVLPLLPLPALPALPLPPPPPPLLLLPLPVLLLVLLPLGVEPAWCLKVLSRTAVDTPKSASLQRPWRSSSTLPHLRSRWMIFLWWRYL